jgi:hypothetical protein
MTRHAASIGDLSFDDRGRTLASTDVRGSVQLWDSMLWTTSRHALKSRLCAAVGQNLRPLEWERLLPGEPYNATCPRG